VQKGQVKDVSLHGPDKCGEQRSGCFLPVARQTPHDRGWGDWTLVSVSG
jgi:hypothetical protein